VSLDATADSLCRVLMKAILLRDQHLHELPSSSKQGLKLLRRVVGNGPGCGTDTGREAREDFRVNLVGFFELPERLCEVSDLPRIHGNTGQPRGEKLAQCLSLITTSSLQDHKRHLTGLQGLDELRDSSIIVGVPLAIRLIIERNIQVRLGDVDAYEYFSCHNQTAFPPRSLRLHPTLRDAGV